MPRAPLVALLTDFGTADTYTGVLKGVLLGITPDLPLVDITHEVPAQDVLAGAWLLHTAWQHFPRGTVFLCVVDPGVGTARRPVALAVDERLFVGPDNGLFSYVLAAAPCQAAVVLDRSEFHRQPLSNTFHGRDLFAPCAARLAGGEPLARLGSPIAPESLVRLPLPTPRLEGQTLEAQVVQVDRYGNLITSLGPDWTATLFAAPTFQAEIAGQQVTQRARTFGEGPTGQPFALVDSSGYLAIAVRDGSAAALLRAGRGSPLRLTYPVPG